jgi:hypothetical protein
VINVSPPIGFIAIDPEMVIKLDSNQEEKRVNIALRSIDKPLIDQPVQLNGSLFEDHNVSVYPNPAWQDLNLRFRTFTEREALIRIFDHHGKQVLFTSMEGLSAGQIHQGQLDIRSLPKGFYLVKVSIGGKDYDFPVIVGD